MKTTQLPFTVVLLAILLGAAAPPLRGADATGVAPEVLAAKKKLIGSIGVAKLANGRQPNVLFILADDLGYADLGSYGSKDIPTPNIDSLAKTGVRCTDGYVTAGTCSPSRAGMLSGRYQQRYGFEFNCNATTARNNPGKVGIDPAAVSVADVMKQAGYATGMCGKWHMGFEDKHHPMARGFDEFFGFLSGAHQYLPKGVPGVRIVGNEGGAANQIMRGKEPIKEETYLTEAFAREACAFIEKHKDGPFYLYVPFNAVHLPFQVTDKYVKRFANIKDEKRRVYYAMVSALDDAVGDILNTLRKNQLDENTIVVLLSDNGGPTYTDVQSNGPLRLGKLFLFEGGIRVPFILRWPAGLKPDKVYREPVSGLDLLPTFAAAAGAVLPKEFGLDGVNLMPYLRGDSTGAPHETLFWRNGPNRAVRKGNWKLVQAGNNVWLFDLSTDLGEKTNLAEKRPEIVKELQEAYDRWAKEMKPPAWPSRPGKAVDVDGKKYEIHV